MSVRIINIEMGMPTADQARIRLSSEIKTAKVMGAKVVKIIHGYGSSGKGGALKRESFSLLNSMQKQGVVKSVIKGEDFSIFNPETRNAIAKYSFLSKDSDMDRANHGITIVVIK